MCVIQFQNFSEFLLETYFDDYNESSDAKRKNIDLKQILIICLLKYIIMACGLKMKNQLIKKNL